MENPQIDHIGDFNIDNFTNFLFSQEPMPPHSLIVVNNNNNITNDIANILGNILVKGAKYLWNLQLCQLNEEQIYKLRQYLWSMGYDADYVSNQEVKMVTDYHPDGTAFNREIKFSVHKMLFKLYR